MASSGITFSDETTTRHVIIGLAGVLLPISGMGVTLWLIGRNPSPLMWLIGAVTIGIWAIALAKARLYAHGRAGGALMHRLYQRLFAIPFAFYEALSEQDRLRYGQARLAWVGLWDKSLVPILIAGMMLLVAWSWSGSALIPLLALWMSATLIVWIIIWRTPAYPNRPQQTLTTDIIAHIGELRHLNALAWMMRRWWVARPRGYQLDWVAHRFASLMMLMVICLVAIFTPDPSAMPLAGLMLGYGALARASDALIDVVRVAKQVRDITSFLHETSPLNPLSKWRGDLKPPQKRIFSPYSTVGTTFLSSVGVGDTAPTIHIHHLTFGYRTASMPILHDLTLTIGAGQLVGVVGKTGSGKSALLWALLGIDPPQHGAIHYDTLSLDAHGATIRRHIGAVGAWSRVHRGSVLMNIAGRTRGTLERAWQVAELVGLADFIAGLPMEMHTIIDDDGAVFSEGQRGRLLLARALFYHPKILLLDEALGSVDESLEVTIHQNLAPLGMTRVIITHRRKTLMLADTIIVLDNGRVIQHGTYDTLMAEKGIFGDIMAVGMI